MALDAEAVRNRVDAAARVAVGEAGKVLQPRRHYVGKSRPNNKTYIAAEIDTMAEIVCVYPENEEPVLCHCSKCRKILGACLYFHDCFIFNNCMIV